MRRTDKGPRYRAAKKWKCFVYMDTLLSLKTHRKRNDFPLESSVLEATPHGHICSFLWVKRKLIRHFYKSAAAASCSVTRDLTHMFSEVLRLDVLLTFLTHTESSSLLSHRLCMVDPACFYFYQFWAVVVIQHYWSVYRYLNIAT